jgi:hypothetical protein
MKTGPITFEVRVYESGPRFCIPVNQRDALGLPREGEGDNSVLFLQVWDAVNRGRRVTSQRGLTRE